jgi:anti-sigma B factor antagonist
MTDAGATAVVPFRVTTRQEADLVVVTVLGAVDTLTAETFRQRVIAAFELSPRVVCDISTVGFFDSTGLGALVDGRNRAVAIAGSLELVCTNPSMLKLFSITGLDELFPVHRSLDDLRQGTAIQV